jgi:hypothetical protein
MIRHLGAILTTAVSLAGCASDGNTTSEPGSVAGDYSLAFTDTSTNNCALGNWTNGASTTNVGFTVTQAGTSIAGTVNGLAGDADDVAYGTNTYQGTLSGQSFHMSTTSRAMAQGNCAYTLEIDMDGTFDGNTLNGTRSFHGMTNNGSDCGALNDCESIQQVSGARPPAE